MSEKLATRVRLSRQSFRFMRVLSAKENHPFADVAYCWSLAKGKCKDLQPLFNPQSNKRRIYVTEVDALNHLSGTWDCTQLEAAHSAINHSPSHIEGE